MSTCELVSQIILWIPIRNYVHIKRVSLSSMIVHLKPLLVLFIPAIAISLYKYMDKIMIGYMSSRTELGLYENAEKITTIPLTLIGALGVVMMPKMSNLIACKKRTLFMEYINISAQFVFFSSFAFSFGLAAIAKKFAIVYWGNDFESCGLLIMGLSITIPFVSFANVIRMQFLIPNEYDNQYITSVVLGALINVIINYHLIPRQGAYGAMIGTIAAEIVVCCIQVIVAQKDLPIKHYIKNGIPFLFAGSVMFFAVQVVGQIIETSIMGLIIQIATGVIVYCLLTSLILFLMRNELFLNLLRRYLPHFHL